MSERTPLDVEALLRSQWGRLLFVTVLVLAVSLAMAVPRFEIAELRGHEFSRWSIYLDQVFEWGAWGLISWPMLAFARWLLRTSGSWVIFLLVQAPVSLGCAYGFLELGHLLRQQDEMRTEAGRPPDPRPGNRPPRFEDPPPFEEGPRLDDEQRPDGPPRPNERDRGRSRRRRGFGSDSPSWDSPRWRFRWIESTLVYWVILGMGAGLLSFLEMREKERRAAVLELRAERLRSQLAHAQVDTLRNQLHPHFLFNALHSVGGLVRAGEDQMALRTLSAIGDLLRSTLDHGDAEEVSLSDELRIAERYLDIERIRLGERLVAEVETSSEFEAARVPAMLLLPLIENAVRHGIAPLPEGGRVQVRVWREGSSLFLEVSDDGAGFPLDVLEGTREPRENGRRSIGLENTRGRLKALYGDSQQFELSNSEPRGALVRVVLPYHEESVDFSADFDHEEGE